MARALTIAIAALVGFGITGSGTSDEGTLRSFLRWAAPDELLPNEISLDERLWGTKLTKRPHKRQPPRLKRSPRRPSRSPLAFGLLSARSSASGSGT
jgi:hypothetical protein